MKRPLEHRTPIEAGLDYYRGRTPEQLESRSKSQSFAGYAFLGTVVFAGCYMLITWLVKPFTG